MDEENLTKVHVDLPNSEEVGGESLWAEDLGGDLYRIRNVPFYAFGLNFYDVVYAKSESDDLKPSVIKVKTSSGHKTLRVIFTDESTKEERINRLKKLNKYKAYHENANGVLFAIDVEVGGDYEAVCDMLYEWESQKILSYETCETRIEGSFDAN
ncbi:MAG: DUF4265 domain-containing protein [Candidatus Thiodiazotropha taylori]|uniref:DUF4265 domain-containing protein n=1 Tax=Candidatus Thiodiazotropha taylori TaxID=2792791 RepID=A0A9E4KDV8_9GAMM|nr:DUF4265 domain-containing protein [Candidatus Thiodiazotropha taylori]MCW4257414.1 DUF4265 domain-containing protein [Candidatus Thiodiazotropha taylori]